MSCVDTEASIQKPCDCNENWSPRNCWRENPALVDINWPSDDQLGTPSNSHIPISSPFMSMTSRLNLSSLKLATKSFSSFLCTPTNPNTGEWMRKSLPYCSGTELTVPRVFSGGLSAGLTNTSLHTRRGQLGILRLGVVPRHRHQHRITNLCRRAILSCQVSQVSRRPHIHDITGWVHQKR